MESWGHISTLCLILADHWNAKGCFNALPAAFVVNSRIRQQFQLIAEPSVLLVVSHNRNLKKGVPLNKICQIKLTWLLFHKTQTAGLDGANNISAFKNTF